MREGTKVFPAHRTFDCALSTTTLVLSPDLHTLDVDVVSTAVSGIKISNNYSNVSYTLCYNDLPVYLKLFIYYMYQYVI